jgi:hypothetical protein
MPRRISMSWERDLQIQSARNQIGFNARAAQLEKASMNACKIGIRIPTSPKLGGRKSANASGVRPERGWVNTSADRNGSYEQTVRNRDCRCSFD